VNNLNEGPLITRVRHELKRRTLTITRVERLPAGMVRIVLGGEELQGFKSLGFDDHIKLFFHSGNEDSESPPSMRDFTPRRFSLEQRELWIDFFLHESGPAASWAARASAGQQLLVAGPKGSSVIAVEGIDEHLLIGDETALPAIARRLEELPVSARAVVVIEVEAGADRPELMSPAAVEVTWVARDRRAAPGTQALVDALRKLEIAPDRCFAWIACESSAARAIRAYLRQERGFDKRWIKAAGYWQQGTAGSHDSIADEA
jgi:NADPH-dependent ferric siderophore reductase